METQTLTAWAIDKTHSEIQFKVKHLVISTVTGHFRNFEGTLETESQDFDGASIDFQLDVNSIDTNQSDRDGHLKSDDFFAAEKFPHITFKNGRLNKTGNNTYNLVGELTIRDITQSVTLKVELGGVMKDPYGNTKAGFEVLGSVNRKSFGLNWNAVTEAGGVVVGDEVKLQMNVQLAQQ
ncbi:MAG: YceI family protein [Flavobacteriales bacterium]